MLKPWMLTAAKISNSFGEIFQAEYLKEKYLSTPLQILCKIMLNSKVIVKSILDLEGKFWRNGLN